MDENMTAGSGSEDDSTQASPTNITNGSPAAGAERVDNRERTLARRLIAPSLGFIAGVAGVLVFYAVNLWYWPGLGVVVGIVFLAAVFFLSRQADATARKEADELAERERTSVADLPPQAQELINFLRVRYDESAALYNRSLRASPVLFTAGVACATLAVSAVIVGTALAVVTARESKPLNYIALIETGSAAVLLGIMGTGFFSWRRDMHKHALTFFCDMIHTRSTSTAIRMIASMKDWIGPAPHEETYVRLIRRVARREAIRVESEGQPRPLAPVAPEVLMELTKELSSSMVKLATVIKK